MEEIIKQFHALSVTEQRDFFEEIGAKPAGWLYAYKIPIHHVQVHVDNERHNYRYTSEPGDWSLVKMGMTNISPVKRLNYFKSFHEAVRPNKKKDMIYIVNADTAWEDRVRLAAALFGVWDIGGKSTNSKGYFKSKKEWGDFLGCKRAGLTECVIIPTTACTLLQKEQVTLPVYPRTAAFCDTIREIVESETDKLLGERSKRGDLWSIQLWKTQEEKGPLINFTF